MAAGAMAMGWGVRTRKSSQGGVMRARFSGRSKNAKTMSGESGSH